MVLCRCINKRILSKLYDSFFEERNIEFEVTEEDERVLRENTADFVSFSYYQSSVTSYEEKEKTAGNLVVTTKIHI